MKLTLFLSVMSILAAISFAHRVPGKCPEVERAQVADAKKLEGEWFLSYRTRHEDETDVMHCARSTWTLDPDGKTFKAQEILFEGK